MKRTFSVNPQTKVTASSDGIATLEIDEGKVRDVAEEIMNGYWDDQINGRDEDIEWGEYESADDLAHDVPAILYLLFGFEDGEDYQLINDTIASYIDTANGLWKQAKKLLS